jgi:hypothetical protein
MYILMVNSVHGCSNANLATYISYTTFLTAETEVFFLRFPTDLLFLELWGVLVLESFDIDFTRIGIRLTFGTGMPSTDFLPLERSKGVFLLVRSAWKFNHMFNVRKGNKKYTVYNSLIFPEHITQF